MNTRWLVAKFMPDVRRREPVNIGVILNASGSVHSRFRGQTAAGHIDGRLIPVDADLENYKAWIDYWRFLVSKRTTVEEMITKRPDENYYLEPSGEFMSEQPGQRPDDVLDYLYSLLVADEEPEEPIPVKRQSEQALKKIGVWGRVSTDFIVELHTTGSLQDYTRFDYRYENGRLNLMRALTLSDREDSLHIVHGAKYEFEAVRRRKQYKESNLISLVVSRSGGPRVRTQRAILDQISTVIDFAADRSAEKKLAAVLHSS